MKLRSSSCVFAKNQSIKVFINSSNKESRDLRIVFFRSNRISNQIGRPIRFRIESSNRIGHIPRTP